MPESTGCSTPRNRNPEMRDTVRERLIPLEGAVSTRGEAASVSRFQHRSGHSSLRCSATPHRRPYPSFCHLRRPFAEETAGTGLMPLSITDVIATRFGQKRPLCREDDHDDLAQFLILRGGGHGRFGQAAYGKHRSVAVRGCLAGRITYMVEHHSFAGSMILHVVVDNPWFSCYR